MEFLHLNIADGVSCVMPAGWEFRAESIGDHHVRSVEMTNGSCSAQFELLNNAGLSPTEFVSSYRFHLLSGLVQLGVSIREQDPNFPYEILGAKAGVNGTIVHIFRPTQPVTHISAIAPSLSDLLEVRLIAESLSIDEAIFATENHSLQYEEPFPLSLSSDWQKTDSV